MKIGTGFLLSFLSLTMISPAISEEGLNDQEYYEGPSYIPPPNVRTYMELPRYHPKVKLVFDNEPKLFLASDSSQSTDSNQSNINTEIDSLRDTLNERKKTRDQLQENVAKQREQIEKLEKAGFEIALSNLSKVASANYNWAREKSCPVYIVDKINKAVFAVNFAGVDGKSSHLDQRTKIVLVAKEQYGLGQVLDRKLTTAPIPSLSLELRPELREQMSSEEYESILDLVMASIPLMSEYCKDFSAD